MGTKRTRRYLETSLQRRLQSYFKGSAMSSQVYKTQGSRESVVAKENE